MTASEEQDNFCEALGDIPEEGERDQEAIEAALSWALNNWSSDMMRYCRARNVGPKDAEDIVYSLIGEEFYEELRTFECTIGCDECKSEAAYRWLFSALKIKVDSFFSDPLQENMTDLDIDEIALADEKASQPFEELQLQGHDEPSVGSEEALHLPDEEISKGELFYADPKREIELALHRAIKDLLTKRERQYVIARFFHGAESEKEAAEMLGIKPGNARVIKHRLLKKLAKSPELKRLIEQVASKKCDRDE